MGKSQQAGWVSTRGKYWYGYYRETMLDSETNEPRVKKIPVRLGLKTQLNKLKARNLLREALTKRNGQVPEGRVLKDSSVTFEWFVRNRYFPLRKGDWRPETAVTKMDQIEIDLTGKFGEYPLDALDKFVLQTHLTALATRYCQDRVKQARSYMKSIFDRGHGAGVPREGPDPEAEDPKESSAQGQAGAELGTTVVDSGDRCQKRSRSACP